MRGIEPENLDGTTMLALLATPADLYGEDAQLSLDAELAPKREPAVPQGETSAPTTLPEYRRFQAERVERTTKK